MAISADQSHDNGMAKTTSPLLPATSELLTRFGERLRLARLRRRLSAKQVAERAGMVPMTLRSVERGGPGVTMGAYLSVMQVLGIERDLEQLAAADPLGRQLQDSRLRPHRGAAGSQPATPSAPTERPPSAAAVEGKLEKLTSRDRDRRWVQQSGFASATELASLIAPRAAAAKKRR
jgi:transcriptional regulator with XRE-family HTH domain